MLLCLVLGNYGGGFRGIWPKGIILWMLSIVLCVYYVDFNVAPFGGQKYFVISQSNFFGSKNDFLSITYLVVGGLCLLIGMLFLGKKIIKNKSQ